jgi:hypothetical protein
LTNQRKNVIWSAEINCQTYVAYWLQRHGFQWPHQLSYLTEDHTPVIIDVAIEIIHLSAATSVKLIPE